jgi:hypothetical protein
MTVRITVNEDVIIAAAERAVEKHMQCRMTIRATPPKGPRLFLVRRIRSISPIAKHTRYPDDRHLRLL